MSLKTQIESDIKQAMLAKEKDKLTALRAIKSLILLEETKEGRVHGTEVTEAEEIQLLSKAAKQRRESAEIFEKQNRQDLADKEKAELEIIESYLPKQLSEAELKEALQAIIARVGASAPSDMGKVMGVATKELAGKADGKAVSQMVKQLLA
ncbi:MAG: GatB/YqeY domain-containing protein [Bacteroidetes bacterium]|nr:MAG: GatB/YqeY domain-containing protein [Bacteroidota bacterium]